MRKAHAAAAKESLYSTVQHKLLHIDNAEDCHVPAASVTCLQHLSRARSIGHVFTASITCPQHLSRVRSIGPTIL